MVRSKRSAVLIVTLSVQLVCVDALAQENFPSKPQRVVAMGVGFPEYTARVVGGEIEEMTKQRIIVEPKPGANGIIAAEYVARATPDGYTLLVGTNSTHAANQSLFKKLPYDYVKDFVPVSGLAVGQMLLLVHPSVPAKSVQELTALARQHPDRLTFGSGSSSSLAAIEFYKLLTNVKLMNVPYKTVPQAATDLVGGRIDMMVVNLAVAQPHLQSKRVRALAITGRARWPTLPDVPTMRESGVKDYEWSFWNAAWLPAQTPPAVVARMNELIVAALNRSKVKDYLFKVGSTPFPTTSDELMKFQLSEHDKWRKVIVAAGIEAK